MLGAALPVGCGQCTPCRINRARLWGHRQLLESMCHADTVFVTLTYSDENVGDGNLRPPDFVNYLKRLRDRVGYNKFRYFGCGEYGPQTWRPHYHVNLFGLGVEYTELIDKCWGLGFTSVFPFTEARARYCTEYTVKGMTKPDDWRLDGRTPEFARMSRRPGIGAPAVAVLAEQLYLKTGWDIIKEQDVPKNLKLGRQSLVLGRYLRHLLRDEIGMSDDWKEAIKQNWISEKAIEMLPLQMDAKAGKAVTARQLLVEKMMGRIQSVEAQQKLRGNRKL